MELRSLALCLTCGLLEVDGVCHAPWCPTNRARSASRPSFSVNGPEIPFVLDVEILAAYHSHWDEFHCTALDESISGAEYLRKVDEWKSRIPEHYCGCGTSFEAIISERPLNAAIADDLEKRFVWTVDIHDDVNQKLVRPSFGIEKASLKYFYAAPAVRRLTSTAS